MKVMKYVVLHGELDKLSAFNEKVTTLTQYLSAKPLGGPQIVGGDIYQAVMYTTTMQEAQVQTPA
jgi:hypothetical protein